MCTANRIKIICQGDLGNDMSQIPECETVAASDFMSMFGDIEKPFCIIIESQITSQLFVICILNEKKSLDPG